MVPNMCALSPTSTMLFRGVAEKKKMDETILALPPPANSESPRRYAKYEDLLVR